MKVNIAERFAKEKHSNQKRKFSNEPYFNHVKNVSEIVKKYKKSHRIDDLIAAALLHDILEDTNTSEYDLKNIFGDLIASLVRELTSNNEKIEKKGKKEYLAEKMSNPKKMSNWALVIKLADRLDNISDKSSDEFAKKYSKETKYILNYLEKNRKLTKTQRKLLNSIRGKLK